MPSKNYDPWTEFFLCLHLCWARTMSAWARVGR
jgi:hypothetical protein